MLTASDNEVSWWHVNPHFISCSSGCRAPAVSLSLTPCVMTFRNTAIVPTLCLGNKRFDGMWCMHLGVSAKPRKCSENVRFTPRNLTINVIFSHFGHIFYPPNEGSPFYSHDKIWCPPPPGSTVRINTFLSFEAQI